MTLMLTRGGGGGGVNFYMQSFGKITTFLGKYFYFRGLGKHIRMKLRDKGKILGRNEKFINCMGKLNEKLGKQC